jgi:hypothetical protein
LACGDDLEPGAVGGCEGQTIDDAQTGHLEGSGLGGRHLHVIFRLSEAVPLEQGAPQPVGTFRLVRGLTQGDMSEDPPALQSSDGWSLASTTSDIPPATLASFECMDPRNP